MTEDEIEKVAAAIMAKDSRGRFESLPTHNHYVMLARAAITALDQYREGKVKEPPPICIQCGSKPGDPCFRDHREPDCWAEERMR